MFPTDVSISPRKWIGDIAGEVDARGLVSELKRKRSGRLKFGFVVKKMISFETSDVKRFYCHWKYPLRVGSDLNHWSEVHPSIFHEAPAFQGFNFICCWFLLCSYWMAHVWHDCGDIWFYCPLQWLLANTGCLSTEVAHSWLGASTTICDIVPWTEQRQTSTSMRILGQTRSKESEKTGWQPCGCKY
ncbi:hypothetical protein F0562_018591 [Nyssa sinensis]|uniref:Uncharacterized protein n=1 Tax=Nyssa sinensis TaxID=561372 RepID=A0A5J4ZE78_9ASTE|nr:hypothetical protein F0562_018591 [Nyssa sinensis]